MEHHFKIEAVIKAGPADTEHLYELIHRYLSRYIAAEVEKLDVYEVKHFG